MTIRSPRVAWTRPFTQCGFQNPKVSKTLKRCRKRYSNVSTELMPQFVWLFARPLSLANLFSPFELTSQGRYHLCHWGVLVSHRSVTEAKELLIRSGSEKNPDVVDSVLGIMWELNRMENDTNTVNTIRPFTVATVKDQWTIFSAEYLGETVMDYAQIQTEGTPVESHTHL